MNPSSDRSAFPALTGGATLPLLIVLALAVAGYSHLLGSGDIIYSPHSDVVTQHYASLVKQRTSSGGLPFWRSDQFSGYPHFSNPQSFTTNPLYAIYYFISPSRGLNLVVWLHLLTAAVAFYFAGAVLGLSRMACLFMAVAGLFNFKLIIMIYAGLLPLLPSIVLLPLFVALAVRLLRLPPSGGTLRLPASGGTFRLPLSGGTLRSASTRTSVAFGACAAVCLLAGHFQILFYATTILCAFVLWELGANARGGNYRLLASQLRCLASSVAVCLGLVAFKYVPFFLEMGLLSRADITHQEFLFRQAPRARHLLTLFGPEILGTPLDQTYALNELWEDVLYFGLTPLLLALAGFAIPSRSAKAGGVRGFALFGFLASLLLAFNTPLQELMFEYFPGFHLFRIPGRYFHLTALFGILLAGVGVDRLKEMLARRAPASGRRMIFYCGILLAVMAVEGAYYGKRYLKAVPLEEAFPKTAYEELFQDLGTEHRIAPIVRATLSYGWAAHMNLQLVSGYDSYNFAHYQQYMDILRSGGIMDARSRVWCDINTLSRLDLLDALSVKYLIAPFPIDLPGDRIKLVAKLPLQPAFVFYRGMRRADLSVYENLRALPRAYLANRVVVAQDEQEMLGQVLAGELGKTAVIIGAERAVEVSVAEADSAGVLQQRDGHLELEVETASGGLVVVSEVWHPGWRAEIEEQGASVPLEGKRRVPVYRTNLSLMSIEVPAGKCRIQLDFRPMGWPVGVVISIATLAATLLLVVGGGKGRNAGTARAQQPVCKVRTGDGSAD